MTTPAALRGRAEGLAATLPPLLAEAEKLAAGVMPGEHGRRRAGMGDEFWQYRAAHPGDEARLIDWRRSARSDAHYVREREWQAAQAVTLWVDAGQSMAFSGDPRRAPKVARARLLALAAAVLLIRAGERVGLSGTLPPRTGEAQLHRIGAALMTESAAEHGQPVAQGLQPHGRALFLSDFLGDLAPVEAALGRAADQGVRGVLVQVLDPVEEAFPFEGRTIFESMTGALRHQTLRAGDLRARYLDRLNARKGHLAELARGAGWQVSTHHTGDPALGALLWVYRALEGAR